jgi:hypothetical protein
VNFVVEAAGEAELFWVEFWWLFDTFVVIALVELNRENRRKLKVNKRNFDE